MLTNFKAQLAACCKTQSDIFSISQDLSRSAQYGAAYLHPDFLPNDTSNKTKQDLSHQCFKNILVMLDENS